MAKKGENRERVTLRCKSCKSENYRTEKNKKNTPDRLSLNKYCKKENRVTEHEEKK